MSHIKQKKKPKKAISDDDVIVPKKKKKKIKVKIYKHDWGQAGSLSFAMDKFHSFFFFFFFSEEKDKFHSSF